MLFAGLPCVFPTFVYPEFFVFSTFRRLFIALIKRIFPERRRIVLKSRLAFLCIILLQAAGGRRVSEFWGRFLLRRPIYLLALSYCNSTDFFLSFQPSSSGLFCLFFLFFLRFSTHFAWVFPRCCALCDYVTI